MKVFSNMKRSTKGFSGQEVPLFSTMLDAAESSHSPSRSTSSPSPTPTSSPTPESTHTQPVSSYHTTPQTLNSTQPSPTLLAQNINLQLPHYSPSPCCKKKDTASEEVPQLVLLKYTLVLRRKGYLLKNKSEKRKDKGKEQMHEEQRAQIARDAEIARQWEEEEKKKAMDEAESTKKIDWNDPSVLRYHSLKMKPNKAYFEKLWGTLNQKVIKERYSSSAPKICSYALGDLHTKFEPDKDDEIWKDQHEYNLLSWRLCDFCGIHILLMNNGLAIHMLTEKKYPLSQEMCPKI
ncbi:hypothetical protein Tco_0611670 [Tanacetum coccineum]